MPNNLSTVTSSHDFHKIAEIPFRNFFNYRSASEGDNALGSVRPAVHLFICLCSHG